MGREDKKQVPQPTSTHLRGRQRPPPHWLPVAPLRILTLFHLLGRPRLELQWDVACFSETRPLRCVCSTASFFSETLPLRCVSTAFRCMLWTSSR